MKIQAYKDFNHTFKAFIKDIKRCYPDVKEFDLILVGLKVVKNIDYKMPQQLFHATIQSYKHFILNRDDSFFLDPNFSLPDDYNYIYKQMIPVFVNLWKAADVDNRNAIWNHLSVCILKSNACSISS